MLPAPPRRTLMDRPPVWANWGPLGTLLLIVSITAAILFIMFVGLLMFGVTGALYAFRSEETRIPLQAYLFLLAYFGALIAACVAFAWKQRLTPLLLMLAVAIALIAAGILLPILPSP